MHAVYTIYRMEIDIFVHIHWIMVFHLLL